MAFSQTSADLLFTSSMDGTVRGWDLRSDAPVFVFETAEIITCLSSNGTDSILVGGGAAGNLYYWFVGSVACLSC